MYINIDIYAYSLYRWGSWKSVNVSVVYRLSMKYRLLAGYPQLHPKNGHFEICSEDVMVVEGCFTILR